jgi:hypothetical protein
MHGRNSLTGREADHTEGSCGTDSKRLLATFIMQRFAQP